MIRAESRETLASIAHQCVIIDAILLVLRDPWLKGGFGDLTAHDFLRVNTDAPGLRVLNIDPPVVTVDDFLTAEVGLRTVLLVRGGPALGTLGYAPETFGDIRGPEPLGTEWEFQQIYYTTERDFSIFLLCLDTMRQECDELVAAACASGDMKVSAVGGAENVNIRTSRTVTLDVPALKDHPTKKAILRAAELLLPQLAGLGASKNAFKSPTSASPFSFELPQVGAAAYKNPYSLLNTKTRR